MCLNKRDIGVTLGSSYLLIIMVKVVPRVLFDVKSFSDNHGIYIFNRHFR